MFAFEMACDMAVVDYSILFGCISNLFSKSSVDLG